MPFHQGGYMKKGQIIYIVISLILTGLMFHPNSTQLFSMTFSDLSGEGLIRFIPDLISIVILLLGYGILRMFYKKRALYIKLYPIYACLVMIAWTVLIQFK